MKSVYRIEPIEGKIIFISLAKKENLTLLTKIINSTDKFSSIEVAYRDLRAKNDYNSLNEFLEIELNSFPKYSDKFEGSALSLKEQIKTIISKELADIDLNRFDLRRSTIFKELPDFFGKRFIVSHYSGNFINSNNNYDFRYIRTPICIRKENISYIYKLYSNFGYREINSLRLLFSKSLSMLNMVGKIVWNDPTLTPKSNIRLKKNVLNGKFIYEHIISKYSLIEKTMLRFCEVAQLYKMKIVPESLDEIPELVKIPCSSNFSKPIRFNDDFREINYTIKKFLDLFIYTNKIYSYYRGKFCKYIYITGSLLAASIYKDYLFNDTGDLHPGYQNSDLDLLISDRKNFDKIVHFIKNITRDFDKIIRIDSKYGGLHKYKIMTKTGKVIEIYQSKLGVDSLVSTFHLPPVRLYAKLKPRYSGRYNYNVYDLFFTESCYRSIILGYSDNYRFYGSRDSKNICKVLNKYASRGYDLRLLKDDYDKFISTMIEMTQE